MDISTLTSKSQALGIDLTLDMQNQFLCYANLLKDWNEKINLTAINEQEEVIEKHFYDCIMAMKGISLQGNICDVGTGAGFPGLVFKIVYPQLTVTLVEPTLKRCHFLQEVVRCLELKDVIIYNERAEDFVKRRRETFDLVTARAVANLSVLAELCIPLVKVNGIFLAMKGHQGLLEAEEAKFAIATLGCCKEKFWQDHLINGDTRFNLIYRKQKETPKQYPRAYARIKKKPLGK